MKTRTKECPKIARYGFWAVIVFLILWISLFSQNSFLHTAQLRSKVNKLELEVARFKAVNDSLAKDNARLKTDPDAAEKAARELFGLTKPDEKVFRFVPAKEDK